MERPAGGAAETAEDECVVPALAEAKTPGTPPTGYYKVSGDEFNGTDLNSTFWNYRARGARRDAYNVTNVITFNGSDLVITTYTLNGSNFTGMVATVGTDGATLGQLARDQLNRI